MHGRCHALRGATSGSRAPLSAERAEKFPEPREVTQRTVANSWSHSDEFRRKYTQTSLFPCLLSFCEWLPSTDANGKPGDKGPIKQTIWLSLPDHREEGEEGEGEI